MAKKKNKNNEPRLIDYIALALRAEGLNPTLDSDGVHYTCSNVDPAQLSATIAALASDQTLLCEAMNDSLAQGHRLLTRADARDKSSRA